MAMPNFIFWPGGAVAIAEIVAIRRTDYPHADKAKVEITLRNNPTIIETLPRHIVDAIFSAMMGPRPTPFPPPILPRDADR